MGSERFFVWVPLVQTGSLRNNQISFNAQPITEKKSEMKCMYRPWGESPVNIRVLVIPPSRYLDKVANKVPIPPKKVFSLF